MSDIARLVVAVDTTAVKNAERDLQKFAQASAQMEKATQQAEKATSLLNTTLKGMAGAVSIGTVTVGVKAMAAQLIQAQILADKLGATFKYVSGTAFGAGKEMEYVRKTARELGQDLAVAGAAYAKLSAAAKNTSLEGQGARDVFEATSKAALALGLSADESSRILNAFQQMLSKGTVQSEELKGQMSEALPGAFGIAARAMGKTETELGKMLETGSVLADDLIPKMVKVMKTDFAQAAEEMAGKTQASINRMNTAWMDMKIALAEPIAEPFAKGMESVSTWAQQASGHIKQATKDTASFTDKLKGMLALLGTTPGGIIMGNIFPGAVGQGKGNETTGGGFETKQQAYARAAEEEAKAMGDAQRGLLDLVRKTNAAKAEAVAISKRNDEPQKLRDELAAYKEKNKEFQHQLFYQQAIAAMTREITEAEKKAGAGGRKDASEAFNIRNTQRENFVKLQKQLLDTEIADVEAAQKIAIGNERAFIEQIAKLKEQQLQMEEDALRAGADDAKKSGDNKKAADMLGELATLQARRVEIHRDATRQIRQIENEHARANEKNIETYLDGLRREAEAVEAENENFGKSKKDLKLQEELRLRAAAAIATQNLELAKLNAQQGDEAALEALQQQVDMLEKAADAVKRQTDAMTENELLTAEKKTWEERKRQAEDAARSVEGWFTDAFMRSAGNGKSFFQNMMDSVKQAALRWVIQPIVSPITSMMGGAMAGGGGAMGGMGGMMGGGAGAGGTSLTTWISMGKSLWSGFQGGFASWAGTAVNQIGAQMGNTAVMQFGNGLSGFGGSSSAATMGASVAPYANAAAGVAAGVYGGRAISGGYSAIGGQTGNTAVNVGTIIGSLWGPLGTALGGMIGGLVNRLFGHKAKEVTAVGIQGTYNQGVWSGSNFTDWKQKGGTFRSDKYGSEPSPMDDTMSRRLNKAFQDMQKGAADAGKAMGIATGQLAGFATGIRILFKEEDMVQANDSAEEKARKLEEQTRKVEEAFGKVADDMARMVIPNLDEYRKGQESAAEALNRVATEFVATSAAVEMIGKDSQVAFGAVGVASIGARESLIDLAGGLDQLMALTESFNQNYLDAGERAAIAQKQLAKQTADLGLGAIQSKEQMKAMVMAQDAGTDADRARLVELLRLADTYDKVTKAEAQLAQEARESAMALNSLKLSLAAMGLTAAQVSDKARAAGGGEQFGTNLNSYLTEFEGEATGAAAALGAVVLELGKLGQPLTFTKDGFKALVDDAKAGMLAAKPGADQLWGSLISLAPAFAAAANAVKQMVDASAEAVRNAENAVDSAQQGVNAAYARANEARLRVEEVHQQRQRALDAEARQNDEAGRQEARRQQAQDLQDSRRAEDQARAMSRRDEDRARQDSLRAIDRARQDEAKANDRARQDMLRVIDQARQSARRDEDRARQDAERDADRARAEAAKNADRARQDDLRAQDRALADSRRAEDRALAARRRAEDKARADSIKALEKAYDEAQKRTQKAEAKLSDARSDLTDAYNRESNAIKQTMDRFKQFAKSLRTLRDDLRTGDLSPATPEQKYFDLLEQLSKLIPAAKNGDEDAQARVQQIVQEWLAASQTLYSSSDRYQQDFNYAQQLLAEMASYSEGQSTVAEAQLAALNKAVEQVLPDLIEKTIAVAAAIDAFNAADADFKKAEAEATAAQNEIENAREVEQHEAELRAMEDIAIEDRRLAQERAIEDDRLAQERRIEDQQIADNQRLEDHQLAADRLFEDQRAREDLEWEMNRLAEERQLEDQQLAQARHIEDTTLAADRAIEDRRAAEELEIETRRQAQDRAIVAEQAAEDRAAQERDRAIAAQIAEEEYHRQVMAAEEAVRAATEDVARAERELAAAQDTLAEAQRRHGENLSALARIEQAVRDQAAADAAAAAGLAQLAQAVTTASDNAQDIARVGAAPSGGGAPASPLDALYQETLGRNADASGAAFYAGWDLNAVRQDILGSEEYQQRLRAVRGYAVGKDLIPHDDFLMRAHKGERLLNASDTAAMDRGELDFSRFGKGNGVKALAAELRSVKDELARQREQSSAETKALVMALFEANRQNAEAIGTDIRESAILTQLANRDPVKLK